MGFTFWNEWKKNINLFHDIHLFLDVPVNQMIRALGSVVPIWTMICDMWSPDQSFDLDWNFRAASRIIQFGNYLRTFSKDPI